MNVEMEMVKKELLEERHSNWIKSGPSTLVSEMVGLIEETKRDKGFVLSQEAAMMACVESKRNDALEEIRKSLNGIHGDTESLRFIDMIHDVLYKMNPD
jgi:hypothetical protein